MPIGLPVRALAMIACLLLGLYTVIAFACSGIFTPFVPENGTGFALFNSGALMLGAVIVAMLLAKNMHSMWRIVFWSLALAGFAFGVVDEFGEYRSLDLQLDLNSAEHLRVAALWFLTPFGLFIACRIEGAPRLAIRFMQVGFVVQSVSNLLGLIDARSLGLEAEATQLIAMSRELTELLFIELYLIGLVYLLIAPPIVRARRVIGARLFGH